MNPTNSVLLESDVNGFTERRNEELALFLFNPSKSLLPEFNLGVLNERQTLSNSLNGENPNDYYPFTLTEPSNLNLSLTGLRAKAGVRLVQDLNNNLQIDPGEEIARSDLVSHANEPTILQSLPAGNYIAQVYQLRGNTNYTLGLSASPTASTKVDLVGEFGSVKLPDLRVENDRGQVQLVMFNQGKQLARGPVTVKLYASTDANFDRNDELLTTQTLDVRLPQKRSQTYTLNFDAPTVVAPGSYYLLAQIDSDNTVLESDENNNWSSIHVSAPGTDVVLDWNATLLNAIQSVPTAPPLAARNQAMVHAAIYDAVNAIARTHSPYWVNLPVNSPLLAGNPSAEAAVAAAAHQTLVNLFPTLRTTFDEQLTRSLAEIPDGAAETAGIVLGQSVADQILAARSTDSSDLAQVPYTPGTNPGGYKPTNSDGFVLFPKWGQVTPFAIPNVEAFRPAGPPAFGSDQYAAELHEVQQLGGIDSTVRTPDQTEMAIFWALDRADTFRPPGHWNQIAQTVALQEGNSLEENARLFALMNIAEADAGIVAWDAKYAYDQMRPVTAIHEADADGRDDTIADPNWQPLLPTPPFPDYISGHSTFGAAAATILATFYGQDYAFTATSQELPGVTRSFNSFWEAAAENGISRIYGGIHVQSANVDGLATGQAIANYIAQNFLV